MTDSDSVIIICVTLLILFFYGEPDVHDAVVHSLLGTQPEPVETQECVTYYDTEGNETTTECK